MPLSATEIMLSNIKDALGLIGTGLIAAPFFRVEWIKHRRSRLADPPTSDPRLRKRFDQASQDARDEIDQPSPADVRIMLSGLALLALSFLLSFILPYLST